MRQVRQRLLPHFEKEERTALPILGALVAAVAGKLDPAGAKEALALHKSLRKEYSQMLTEHREIAALLLQVLETAESEEHPPVVEFVRRLLHHAKMEEEVLYPAAIILGDRLQAAEGARVHAPHPSRPYKH